MPDPAERFVNPFEPDLIAALDALGIDGEQDFNAMPGPLRDMRCWDASVEPQGDAAVAEVVGTPGSGEAETASELWTMTRQGGIIPSSSAPLPCPTLGRT